MIRLNRTTEYGLIALRHMVMKRRKNDGSVTSAREVADFYSLPFEITAKTLQRLRDTGIIQSAHGARGGYTLNRPLNEVTLGEFLEMMEGPQGVVGCASAKAESAGAGACEYHGKCEIRGVMSELNHKVRKFLAGIPLGDLTDFVEAGPTTGAASIIEIPVALSAAAK